MDEIKLDVQVREEVGSQKIRGVRGNGFVPGIVYGGDKKPTVIKLDRKIFERLRRQHGSENMIFHLHVFEGDKKLRDYSAIIKEEQHHPVDDHILHVDFKRISLTEKITVKVRTVSKGEPVGVKQDGGSLEHVLWEVEVVCLPTQIPQSLECDVSQLKIGDSIHVRELKIPAEVVVKSDPDTIVFTVVPPMKEEMA